MFTCDICSKEFKRRDNMSRHKKTMHADDENIVVTESEDESDNGSASEEEEVEEEDSWGLLVEDAFEHCQPEFEERVEKHMRRGHDRTEAREHVFEHMKDIYRKALMNSFVNKMLWFNAMVKEPVYKSIKKTVSDLKMGEDFDDEEAWKSATSKRKYLLDSILKMYEAPELEEEDMDTEEDERAGTEDAQRGGGGLPVISRVSPAQQQVEMARSELERKAKKRSASPVSMGRDAKIHIIG